MVSKTFEGKSYAGDPHIWFDEENGVSAKPRRSSHLWRMLRKRCVAVFSLYVVISFTGRCDADCQVFPSLLSYLNRQGVVVENVTGRQGISNKFFTHCEVAGSELVKEGCVKLLKTNATLEWRLSVGFKNPNHAAAMPPLGCRPGACTAAGSIQTSLREVLPRMSPAGSRKFMSCVGKDVRDRARQERSRRR